MSSNKAKPVKVLCAGDVNGQFQQLLARVAAVNQKCGPFDVLFCVGEFFGPDEAQNRRVTDGELQFPISTYILGPCSPSTSFCYPDESAEFSPSLTFLGRKGILNTANGLTIGYFSGIESKPGSEPKPFEFDQKTVDDLLMPVSANSGFMGVDLLLTSMWPAEVSKHSSNQPSRQQEGSKMISRLGAGLRPRYHFAGMGIHYERSPYRNHRVLLESAQHVTRFIGLAPVNNPSKQKWLYAFSITPMRRLPREELVVQPENCSEFPYMEVLQEYLKEKAEEDERKRAEMGCAQYFYDMQANPEEDGDQQGRRKRPHGGYRDGGTQQRKPRIDPNTCWFCLSNISVEKHLIVSVATHCYAAMPKGPLNERHLLVMSIGHIRSLVAASPEVREEVFKYRDAYSLFLDRSNEVLCLFERNFKTEHLQIQFVPVPKAKAKALRSSFLNSARLKNIEFSLMKDGDNLWDLVGEGSPYFYIEFPDGTKMLTRSATQSIQFGREVEFDVFASKALLDCEEKIDWRSCVIGKEKEEELATKLKEQFKPFDFANEDSDED